VLRHYSVEPRADATQNDLAVMAARVFEATVVLEDAVVDKFVDKFCFLPAVAAAAAANAENTASTNGNTENGGSMVLRGNKRTAVGGSHREILDREPAQPGEQVEYLLKCLHCV
jgi:hypothetical protein